MGALRSLKKIIHPTTVDRNNPYAHPSHPNHVPQPVPASAIPVPGRPAVSTASSLPPILPPLRPASPQDAMDYLAEARAVSGRDPNTGRSVRRVMSDTSELWLETPVAHTDEIQHVEDRSRSNSAPTHAITPQREHERQEEISAYNARASKQIRKTGTRYDLFVQSLKLHPTTPQPRATPSFSRSVTFDSILPSTSREGSEPQPETSAYINRVSQSRKSMGTRYDLFVKEQREQRQRVKEEKERRERGFSWYAPEGRVAMVEYYSPRVSGRESGGREERSIWGRKLVVTAHEGRKR